MIDLPSNRTPGGSRRSPIPCLAAFLLIVAAADAQDAIFELKRVGQTSRISITDERSTALAILSRVANELNVRIAIEDPELSHRLDAQQLTLEFSDFPIDEFLHCLGTSLDLLIELDELELRVSAYPEGGSPRWVDFARSQALEFLLRDGGEELSADAEAESLLDRADLQVAAARLDDALLTYDEYLTRFPGHGRIAEACLAAERVALDALRPRDTIKFYEMFIGRFVDHPDQAKAEILLAQAYQQLERFSEANLVLERLARRASRREIPTREGVVAELLLAEHYYHLGHPDKALEVLDRIRFRDQGDQPDLSAHLPIYSGICFGQLHKVQDAVYDLLVGAHLASTPTLRARSLTELARVYLEHDKPFEALAATRMARSAGPDKRDEVRILRFEGLANFRLTLHDKAVESLTSSLLLAKDQPVENQKKKKLVQGIMSDLGDVLFSEQRYDLARRVFGNLITQAEVAERATIMLARCEYQTSHYEEALAILQQLPTRLDDPKLEQEAKELTGDCWVKLGRMERAIRTWSEENP